MFSLLWCGNLRGDVNLDDLYHIFERYGALAADIELRPAPIGSDMYAIVAYQHRAAAAAALQGLQGQAISALTHRTLKLREWAEDAAPRRLRTQGSWRREAGRREDWQPQPRASWADAEGGETLRYHGGTSSSSWRSGGAAPATGVHYGHAEETGAYAEADLGDEDAEDDPLVELWVGNLHRNATRMSIRRAFECFGEVASVQLQQAPDAGDSGLQFAFVELPASAAEQVLEDLDGLAIRELSGDTVALKIKQSKRSLKPLLQWQQRQERRQLRRQQRQATAMGNNAAWDPPAAAAAGPALEAVYSDGSTATLHGPVREIKKLLVCEGPPSSTLWVGNVGGHATVGGLHAVFGKYGSIQRAQLHEAPGYNNTFKFGFITMSSALEAECARDALQGTNAVEICDGRTLKLRYAWQRSQVRPVGNAAAGPAAAAHRSSSPPSAAGDEQRQEQQHMQAAAVKARGDEPERGEVLLGALAPSCASCGTAAGERLALKRCSGCHSVAYCSRGCQLQHWEEQHAKDCSKLAQLDGCLAQQQQHFTAGALRLLLAALQQHQRQRQQDAGGRQAQLVHAILQQGGGASTA